MPAKSKSTHEESQVVKAPEVAEVSQATPDENQAQAVSNDTPVITAQPISTSPTAPMGMAAPVDPVMQPMSTPEANPMMNPQGARRMVETDREPDHSTTRWIVIIVVLLLLIVALLAGGFYYLTQYGPAAGGPPLSPQSLEAPSSSDTDDSMTSGDEQTDSLETVNATDSVEAIEEDLNATDLENIDKELEDIQGEM